MARTFFNGSFYSANMTEVLAANGSVGSTTEIPLTPQEEDTIITLVVVVIGIIAAIILLFSMGIFIDCRTQKKDSLIRKRLRLNIPRGHKKRKDDSKSLASDMCPNGTSIVPGDAIV